MSKIEYKGVYMKVKELIKALLECDPDDFILLSKDAEGNGFHSLSDIEKAVWVPRCKEKYIREVTPELKKRGFTEEDLYNGKDGQKAIVLW